MVNITDNNSSIELDVKEGLTKPTPCDVSIIEKYDQSLLETLWEWISPLAAGYW